MLVPAANATGFKGTRPNGSACNKATVREGGEEIVIRTKVWNPTVANLSLMALGSSAPPHKRLRFVTLCVACRVDINFVEAAGSASLQQCQHCRKKVAQESDVFSQAGSCPCSRDGTGGTLRGRRSVWGP